MASINRKNYFCIYRDYFASERNICLCVFYKNIFPVFQKENTTLILWENGAKIIK